MNNFITKHEQAQHLFRNSGKDYNDFGRPYACSKLDDFNFFMATVLDTYTIPMSLGLCMPMACTLNDLNKFKPTILKIVNDSLPMVFSEKEGIQTTQVLTESDVVFVDPQFELE
jgi:hypothetical protein